MKNHTIIRRALRKLIVMPLKRIMFRNEIQSLLVCQCIGNALSRKDIRFIDELKILFSCKKLERLQSKL